jgi:cytochrome c peroxidase
MNCRACHLVDEQVDSNGNGMRTYNDFARRSPIPDRGDGHFTAPRNSPPLVNASLPREEGLLFHFDGEFATLPDLVRATITGRNYGWLPREGDQAVANLARIVRQDNGKGELAQEFGGLSYRVVLTGKDAAIPAEFRLPKPFRVDVARATDRQIFDAVAELVAAYTEHLEFSTDEDGDFNLSPFDVFLAVNHLPQQPKPDETAVDYSRRLLKRIRQREANGALQFVTSNPNTASGGFDFHPTQPFWFSTEELRGLKIFLSEPSALPLAARQVTAGGVGNCVACHAPPRFTDFRLHNTGATQIEYDTIHGTGAFAHLAVPGLAERIAHHDPYLPATAQHPDATGRFRAVPDAQHPGLTDLGVWNVFANPDFPKTQVRLWQIVCDEELGGHVPAGIMGFFGQCAPSSLLPKTIALFKTPGLRDLSHSAPYIHNGQFDTLEDVIELYRTTSTLERAHVLRNGADDLAGIALARSDVSPLVAFLRSLNEDYQ